MQSSLKGIKKRRDGLRERFIKNKMPLKMTHIFLKKEK
jgi:hypothetical protein